MSAEEPSLPSDISQPNADVSSAVPKQVKCIGRYILTGNTLGKGNFARVDEALHCLSDTKLAIKIIDIDRIQEEYVRKNLLREAMLMKHLKHPNIIRLYETMKTSHLYCMVTEIAEGGELLSHVRHDYKERRLPETAARPFIRQLISALYYLHSQGIAHRDLKMENILLDKKKKSVKIVDFGLSNSAQPGALLATHCGSPEYAAPELFVPGREYGPEVDIWSLGVNMFAMLVGKLPFRSPKQGPRKRQRLLELITNGLSDAHEKEMQHLSTACVDMIKMLLQPDPINRASLREVMVHPWTTKNGNWLLKPYNHELPEPTVKYNMMDLVVRSGNATMETVEDSISKEKCDWISALYNILIDNPDARKIVQKKLNLATKKLSTESRSSGILSSRLSLESSDYLLLDTSSDRISLDQSNDFQSATNEDDPTPLVEESYHDISDIKAGINTIRLHRSPMGTYERRRSYAGPTESDEIYDEFSHSYQHPRQNSIGNRPKSSNRPRIPRTMMNRDDETQATPVKKTSITNNSNHNNLHYYDSNTQPPEMKITTSMEPRGVYNPTHTWERIRTRTSNQTQYINVPMVPMQPAYPAQSYHAVRQYTPSSADPYRRRPYEYSEDFSYQHQFSRSHSIPYQNVQQSLAKSVDWAHSYPSDRKQAWTPYQTVGPISQASLKKGIRNPIYMEQVGDMGTPQQIPQHTMPVRKSKERPSLMPLLTDNVNNMQTYKYLMNAESPSSEQENYKIKSSKSKQPSTMPGTRGYIKSKRRDNEENIDTPVKLVTTPTQGSATVSAHNQPLRPSIQEYNFTRAAGYQWQSDRKVNNSKENLEGSPEKKKFWKFSKTKNKSRERLDSPMIDKKNNPASEQQENVYVTLSKKNVFSSSIHNLHRPADITSLMHNGGTDNTTPETSPTDQMVYNPSNNTSPVNTVFTPNTKVGHLEMKSPETVHTQNLSTEDSNGSEIKEQLQKAIDSMNSSFHKSDTDTKSGYLSDGEVIASKKERLNGSRNQLKNFIGRTFKTGKKKH